MRRMIPLFVTASLLLTGCYATRIVTVAPDTRYQGTYSTTVTVPRTTPVTTTTRVTALSEDISLCLDLQAIGAAFAQSATVQEFENLINNSSYMLSNLDLNQDGYVDYLRVVETVQGGAHVFVIQAVLAPDVYQDVATLVAEVSNVTTACHVQIIGAPYIYGPSYIIEPVFVVRPVIYAHLLRPYYKPWRSPWYWGYYPPCYRHPRPIYINHYHAYVNSYMHNHRYCNEFRYAQSCHYPAYEQMSRPVQRNDYGVSHPERSFSVRNADIPANDNFSPGQTRAANAREIRESVSSSQAVTRSGSSTRSASVSEGGEGVSGRDSGVSSRAASGSSTRAGSGTRSTTGTTGGSETGGSTRTTGSSASPTSGRSSGSATRAESGSSASTSSATPQTTVRSNVRASGTSNTRISTVSPNGTTSTTRRSTSGTGTKSSYGSSAGSSATATRSSGTTTRSSGGSSRSSGGSTRSSAGSTRSSGASNSSYGGSPRSSSSSSSHGGSRR